MENIADYPRVLERFPEWSDLIQQRTQNDADFEEICSDYDQLVKWLVDHCHDGSTQESTLLDNLQLLAELLNVCWIISERCVNHRIILRATHSI